jgi:hypothetical protein
MCVWILNTHTHTFSYTYFILLLYRATTTKDNLCVSPCSDLNITDDINIICDINECLFVMSER